MKKLRKFARKAGALRLTMAAVLAVFFGPLVLLALLGLSVAPVQLGTSYNVINASTKSNLTGQTSKVEEEKWVRSVVLGADHCYQENPFTDGMMGDSDGGKAIVKITDTEKIAGSTVNVPTRGGYGGPGVQGDGTRSGNEQKIQRGNFPVQIGRFWFGVGYTGVARDETLIGGDLDEEIRTGLRFLHAQKRNDDIIMALINHANSNVRNRILPSGIATRALLKTANVVDTTLLTRGKNQLSGLGALPMQLGSKDSGGSRPERFMFLASHLALTDLETEPAYLTGLQYAAARGSDNPIFAGNLTDWNGMGLYRWYQRDHGNWGPIGSPLCPRAFLGTALTGADTNSVVTGGGNATAAAVTPAPKYFQYFSNAAYTFHNGTAINADTTTDRYLMIINNDGTGYAVYNYRVNAGNTITIRGRTAIGVGTEVNDHPIGSLIVECNVLGVPFGRSLAFGREMIVAGQGSINGKSVSPQMGNRTYEERNHGMDIGVGAEAVWGCAVVKRADSVAPGFVIAEHAVTVEGAPVIS